MKTISAVLAGLAFIAVIAVTAAAQDGQQSPELAGMQKAAEKVCMSMTPYLERPDSVKGITVVKNDEINAYADQNDKITIFTGMLNFVRDDNELALVCGHEMAHISAKHIKRSIFTDVLANVAASVIGGTFGNVTGNAIVSKESRKHEREADSRGLLYMWRAGYDPRVGWGFWQNLEAKYKQGGSDVTKFFSDHPVNDERVEDMKVLLVRDCKTWPDLKYCDAILADKDLTDTFNAFENRK
ncbi:MAG: M48 family metallopeptidase [bacterium]